MTDHVYSAIPEIPADKRAAVKVGYHFVMPSIQDSILVTLALLLILTSGDLCLAVDFVANIRF